MGSRSGKVAQWRTYLAATIVVALVVLALFLIQQRENARTNELLGGIWELRQYAQEMLHESEGVAVDDSGNPYIVDFAAFRRYVQGRRPELALNGTPDDAENPFPGLLPQGRYTVLVGTARDGSDVLMTAQSGRARKKLLCNGRLDDL